MNSRKKSKVPHTVIMEEVQIFKILGKFESMTKKGHQKFWRMKRKFLG